jgi:mono/diheme cytochrome c family protein
MKKTTSESRFSALVLAAVIAFGVVACVAWGKPQQAAEHGFAWKDGAEVYEKVCAFCHETKIGPTIRGRGLDPIYVSFMVRNGLRAMLAFREAEIDDQSLQKLAEYVSKEAERKEGSLHGD